MSPATSSGMDIGRKARVEAWLARHPLTAAFVFHAIGFLLVYRIWTPAFMTTDDPEMMLQACGVSVADHSSAYLLFTNVVLGKALKIAYSWAPHVPWYGFYLAGVMFLAYVCILYVVLRNRPRLISLYVYAALFVLAGIHPLLRLQFTIAACMASLAGLMLFLVKGPQTSPGVMTGRAACAAAMVALGSAIRWDAFLMSVALFLPVAVVDTWGQSRAIVIRRAVGFVGAMAICGALYLIDDYERRSIKGWEDYRALDRLIVRLLDDRVLDAHDTGSISNRIARLRWSMNDYSMLSSWVWMDGDRYSAERLASLLAGQSPMKQVRARDVVLWAQGVFWQYAPRNCVLLVFLLAALSAGARSRWALGTVSATVLVLLIYLFLARRPPPLWVYLPLLTSWTMLSIAVTDVQGPSTAHRCRALICLLVTLALLLQAYGTLTMHTKRSREIEAGRQWLETTLTQLNPNRDTLYVIQGAAFPWRWITPFSDLSHLRNFCTFNLWTDQRGPTASETLDRFRIVDLYRALATRKDVLLIPRSTVFVTTFQTYLQEHYGIRTEAAETFRSEYFSVYRFSEKAAP